MPGPLNGFRVIDCTRGTAGPRATGILSDYGADVIWVEPPGGDPYRQELAIPYSAYNRGKRSVTIDIATDEGREQLLALVGGADVFVHSWRPGVAERLGLDDGSVRAVAPHVVYCAISGFGQDGPHRDVPGYEALVHALVGTMGEQWGWREGPIFEGLPFASLGASSLAVIAILAALYRRDDDGFGRYVETSLLDGALAYLTMAWSDSDVPTPRPRPVFTKRLIVRTFECGDGKWLGVHTGAVGAFGRCMTALGIADRVPPSADGLDMALTLTPEEHEIVQNEVPTILASQPRDVWLERLLAADVCVIPALDPTEIFDEPQARHNEMVVTVDDPVLGPVEQVSVPAHFSRTPGTPGGPAPTPGQHNSVLLAAGAALATAPPASSTPSADRPLLDGLKILDFGAYYAGPYSSRLLADLGAEVIKLETLGGDPLRGQERVFPSGHAGKRSIAIDLKSAEGQAIGLELAAWADVVTHNMRPGAAERLGLGYEQIAVVNPEVIYGYSPGWGSTGPDRARQGFAPMYSGYAGISFEVSGVGNPPTMPLGNEDPGNGLLGAIGILMALLHRHRTDQGQLVEHPQINATMAHMSHVVRRLDGTVLGARTLDAEQMGTGPFNRLYRTDDGWVVVVAATAEQRRQLCQLLDVEPNDEPTLPDRLAEAASKRSTADLTAALESGGVPHAVPIPYNNEGFLNDPENRRTHRVAESPHHTRGHMREISKMVRVSDAALAPHRPAPELGEHTDEILAEFHRTPEQIAALRANRVIR